MPSVRAISVLAVCVLATAVSACATTSPQRAAEYMRTPREIRSGAANTVVAPVERSVSREEVATAVSAILDQSQVCMPWPGLWLNEASSHAAYVVRADLMARDWGESVAREGERRMDEFVDMGFLTKRERPAIGVRVHEYALTALGRQSLQGSPYGGDRPIFCAPSHRRLIELTNVEFGQFPCGSVRATFTYSAQDWPAWARTEAARARIGDDLGPIGAVQTGAVSLGRQWFRQDALPDGVTNGSLQSICYNAQAQRVTGNDLNLHAQPVSSVSGS
ncbi:MAG: hypothetical protein WAU68_01990 [Vitreimonas sp.]